MQIRDINGCSIEVTHLDEAIKMAKRYKQYRHEDNNFSELDKRLHAYWTDIYHKLLTLKLKQKS